MPLDRRSFLRTLGAGSAAMALPLIHARGHEARVAGGPDLARAWADAIRLDSNENPLGPMPEALRAATEWFGEAGRYPDRVYEGLYDSVGRYVGVQRDNILFGSGSGEILKVATETFADAQHGVVIGAPTFETVGSRAGTLGIPITAVPVDRALRLDLDGMADACEGAGLIYFCNPNNPTGTVIGGADLREAIGRILRHAPGVTVLVDEAYHEYVDDPAYATMLPLVIESPRVIIARTFSKAFGMAGLRLGYAVAQKDTLERMRPHLVPNNVNQLVGAAAVASLKSSTHLEREKARNAEARRFTTRFFTEAGYTVAESRANFVMAHIRRDSRAFRDACRERGVQVGRPFPPVTDWTRVSIGTMEEMRAATAVFAQVLG